MSAWNPWLALKERPEVVFGVRPLPGSVDGAFRKTGSLRVIVVSQRLGRVERNAALAHELIHDERGGGAGFLGQPRSWAPVVARDEHWVDDEVARRLVPPHEFRALCQRADSLGECLMPWEVAAAFDVPEQVARRAMSLHARCPL